MQLTRFNEIDFLPALKELFGKSNLNIPINYVDDKPVSAKKILQNTYKDNEVFRLINDVYFVGLVDDAAFRGNQSLAIDQIKSDYDGILIFGVTLNNRDHGQLPKRSHLAEISRAFNREFYYTPVVVVFKYTDANSEYLAFANTERLKYKDNREGEKPGKVTLLRDIDIRQPHSGHERILAELAIPTTGKDRVDSFANLYAYWQKVLDVSLLNKNFYRELSNWYFWAVGRVTFPSEPNLLEAQAKKVSLEDLKQEHKSKNVIRLLTRLLFVWFIKEKGLIPPELFNLDDLQRDILKNISPYTDLGLFKQVNQESIYYKAILQNLFFATLNCPIKPMESHDNRVRGFRKMDNYGQHRDANFLMRYREHFQNPERFVEMVNGVVPFLNGGLFECLDDKLNKVFIDGFSDNLPKTEQLIVPDYLFFGAEEKVDLSAEYGATNKGTKEAAVKGLINILKAYKFTITENTPIEEDVALDPELLGKVFENLLASYNPETKTTARKQTGSFYTPREIVNYMVDESLIAYLKNELLAQESGYKEEDLDRQLRQLVSFDAVNPFEGNAEVQKRIIKALDKCTILDPACGSGAFPMGILQKMVHILFKVDPKNTEWKHRQIARVEAAISQLEELDDAQYREQGIQDLNAQIKDIEEAFANNELDYGRKLYLIENCIYGVDIQSIATQISKLRFFISLVVDQKVDLNKDNFGIRPLPNLETKFVAANTLIGIEKPKVQLSLFDTPEIKKLEADLKKVRHRLFSSKSPSHKRKLRDQDKALREKIAVVLQKNGWETDTANKLANWDPYNQNVSSPFFDPEWMFDISDGFDVVIGNPPYVFTRDVEFDGSFKKYIEDEYFSKMIRGKKSKSNQSGKINLFAIFIVKGLFLLKKNAYLSYIVPNNILRTTTYDIVRRYLLETSHIEQVVDLGSGIFDNVTASTVVLALSNRTTTSKTKIITEISDIEKFEFETKIFDQSQFLKNVSYSFNIYMDEKLSNLSKNISNGKKILQSYCRDNIEGIVAHKYLISGEQGDCRVPLVEGKDIKRYFINKPSNFLHWVPEEIHRTRPDYLWNSDNKIVIQRISGGSRPLVCAVDTKKLKTFASTNNLLLKDEFKTYYYFIAALINSDVINWYYANNFSNNSDLTVNISKTFMDQLPIANFSFSISFISQLLHHLSGESHYFQFIEIINAAIFDLYFSDHMKEKEIDVLQFIQRDIEEVMQGKVFEKLDDTTKQKVIEQLYTKWTDTNNEVRDRIKLFAVRSPDILKPILESK
jgi:type I restriction-modification system DNA methylase subunit